MAQCAKTAELIFYLEREIKEANRLFIAPGKTIFPGLSFSRSMLLIDSHPKALYTPINCIKETNWQNKRLGVCCHGPAIHTETPSFAAFDEKGSLCD